MVHEAEQSDHAPNDEKPEICYCSALPKGSGPCLPCYTRWLAGSAKTRFRPKRDVRKMRQEEPSATNGMTLPTVRRGASD
jgi:hypothetical protein